MYFRKNAQRIEMEEKSSNSFTLVLFYFYITILFFLIFVTSLIWHRFPLVKLIPK